MHLESGLADGLYRLSEARHRLLLTRRGSKWSADGTANAAQAFFMLVFYVGKKPAYKKRS